MSQKIYNYSYNFFIKKKIRYPSNLEQLITFCRKKYSIVGSLHSYNDRAIGHGPVSLKKFNQIKTKFIYCSFLIDKISL